MRYLFISTLFPNSVNPTRALYNLRHLTALRELEHSVDVIAPVPWFAGLSLLGRKYPPKQETYEGFRVQHPRFLAPPRFLTHKHYLFYRRAVAPLLRAWSSEHRALHEQKCGEWRPASSLLFPAKAGTPTSDNGQHPTSNGQLSNHPTIPHQSSHNDARVILGFAYPDAVAMAPVCREIGVDYSIFVLGSDFRIRMRQAKFKDRVYETLKQAPRIFCPGKALRDDMVSEGLDGDRIFNFNNGVDDAVFHP